MLVDATECEIERPKKTAEILFRKKEKTYYKGSDSGRRKGFKDTQRSRFRTGAFMTSGCSVEVVCIFQKMSF